LPNLCSPKKVSHLVPLKNPQSYDGEIDPQLAAVNCLKLTSNGPAVNTVILLLHDKAVVLNLF